MRALMKLIGWEAVHVGGEIVICRPILLVRKRDICGPNSGWIVTRSKYWCVGYVPDISLGVMSIFGL